MKKIKRADFVILAVLLAVIIGITLIVMSGGKNDSNTSAEPTEASSAASESKPLTLADYDGKNIGVQTGTTFDEMVKEKLPKANISYFNSYTDLLSALKAGTIDAFAADEPIVKNMMIEESQVDYLNDYLNDYSFGFAFPKNDKGKALCDEFSEYIKQIKSDGTLESIDSLWFGKDESIKDIPDLKSLSDKKGKLSLALESLAAPFVYVRDGEVVGYEVDIAYRFCKEKGYGLEIADMNFDGIIPAISGGKNDFGCSAITITDERKESVNFSESHYDGGAVLAVRSSDIQESNSSESSSQLKLSDYDGKNIAVKTGTTFDKMVEKFLPNSNISFFNTEADLLTALTSGAVDGFTVDEPVIKYMMTQDDSVGYIKEYMDEYEYGFGFTKNDKGKELCDKFSEFIRKIKEDGTLKKIDDLWFSNDTANQVIPPLSELSGENGMLNMAVEAGYAPFIYMKDNNIVGYEIDIAYRFCKEYGYGLELTDMDFQAIIPSVVSGKCDLGAAGMTITDERAESIYFSEPDYTGGAVIAVRKEDIKSDLSSASSPVKVSDYNGKKIGILTGTNMEKVSFTHFPDSEYLYFDGYPNLNTALLNGSIDAFLGDEAALKNIHAKQPEIDYIKERLVHNKYSFAFRKDDEKEKQLCDQFNEFLAKGNANGTIAELDSIWFGSDDSKKVVDLSDLKDTNGTIHVITTTTDEPFSYIKDGKNVGYDIDVIAHFCREYGYALEIGDVDFNARIPALASGKYEFTTSMNVTPEREEEVMFSDPVSEGGIVCAVRAEDLSKNETTNEPDYTDYIGKRIGIQTGSSFESMTFEKFPDSEYLYFDTFSDLITALANDKIDGFMVDEPNIKMASMQQENISYLKKPLMEDNYSFGFQKNTERSNKLRTQFNELLAELKSSGELDKLNEKWFANDDDIQKIDDSGLTGENGEIVVAINPDNLPFAYVSDNELKGLSADLITLFAQKYGYTVKYEYGNAAACIAGITSGKYDILAGSLSVTEERKKSMDFSDVVYNGGAMLAVRSSDLTDTASISDADSSWLSTIKDSFEKNFIREDRYKLVLQGIGTTCLITLLTVIFGSILAFLICMFRRLNSLLAGKIANLYVRLLQGTPIVVLLMILYYVVFGNTGISAIWVAVIGFSLNFAAYVSEILRSGIESIDTGQREAALALGFSENQSFFRFIFPQAAIRQLPVYRGEVISLLKNTSIVGYIAIQDLTKMSDIIRSRTYEAFFPLIATAVIYFIIAWIITLILNIVLKQIDPRSKKRSKKGAAKK